MDNYKNLEVFIQQIEQKLGLTFIEKEDGNVCMANNNSELRDEFKQSFTLADVQSYIRVAGIKEGETIPLPKDATFFFNSTNP